jgi:hypothetical protein
MRKLRTLTESVNVRRPDILVPSSVLVDGLQEAVGGGYIMMRPPLTSSAEPVM